MTATFGALAPVLHELGYHPVPIRPGTKAPTVPGWQASRAPGLWPPQCRRWGTGILTASTPAVDLDIRDKALVRALIELIDELIGGAPIRIGAWPKALLPFHAEAPFGKVASFWFALPGEDWTAPDYKANRVEILGDGQQFVAYAIHPGTGRRYRWARGHLLTQHAIDLPHLDERTAKRLITTLQDVVLRLGLVRLEKRADRWQPWNRSEGASSSAGRSRTDGAPIDWRSVDVGEVARRIDPKGAHQLHDGSWRCRCPVHRGESHTSLSLRYGDDAPIVWHCFAGCDPDEVRDALAREMG